MRSSIVPRIETRPYPCNPTSARHPPAIKVDFDLSHSVMTDLQRRVRQSGFQAAPGRFLLDFAMTYIRSRKDETNRILANPWKISVGRTTVKPGEARATARSIRDGQD